MNPRALLVSLSKRSFDSDNSGAWSMDWSFSSALLVHSKPPVIAAPIVFTLTLSIT